LLLVLLLLMLLELLQKLLVALGSIHVAQETELLLLLRKLLLELL